MVSFTVLVRRMLGRSGTFLLRSALSGLAYHVGLYEYADSTGRDDGISAMMCTYNEEEWVEPSMLSAKDLVDEYVVIDSSNDRTPEIVKEVAEVHGLKVKLIRIPPGNIGIAKMTAMKNSSYKWLMALDADMVLHEHAAKEIKGMVESVDQRRHYLIYWKYLLLCGDVHHVCSDNPYHIEHWLFTYSSKLTYKYLDQGGVYLETLMAPLRLYKPVLIDKVLGVHLAGVRSPEKLALKHIRSHHRRELLKEWDRGVKIDEVLTRICRQVYGVDSLKELGERLLREMLNKLPRYDEGMFGPLPRVLVEHLKKGFI